jgi:aryl-phospho-beta-D-glucosidase BglC (GH1 family)
MTNRRSLSAILYLCALAACARTDDESVGANAAAATTSPSLLPAGFFHTAGNQIVDGSNTPVRLACTGYFAPGDVGSDLPGMVAAGFNCLRYPWYNATLQAQLGQMDQIVSTASSVGLKVIFDHHGDETGELPYPCNGLPFDTGPGTDGTDGCGNSGTVSETRFVQDWATVAQRYAGNATVIGFDLTNEPHLSPAYWALNPGGATWGDGSPTDILVAYQQAGAAIQAVDPGALIIVEGVGNETGALFDGQPTTNAACGWDLTGVAAKPVTLPVGNQVVYSVHCYPASIGGASPDSGEGFIQSINHAWGFVVSQGIAPVWIGEMGASLDGVGPDSTGDQLAAEQAWAKDVVAYANGQYGSQGGPTFSGNQQPMGTDWWAWGRLDGESPDGTVGDDGSLRSQQAAIYDSLLYYPSSSSAPPPSGGGGGGSASSSGTAIPPASQIVDANGDVWTLNGDATISENGAPAGYTANVVLVLFENGLVYQENRSGGWWSWNGSGWDATNQPQTAGKRTGR